LILAAAFGAAIGVPSALAQGLTVGASAVRIGEAPVVVRQVQGTLNDHRRDLRELDPVYWQERIETGADSATRIVFIDGTTISAGPNASVTLDEFVYEGDPDARKVVVGVGKGLMRFISGTQPSKTYEIRTPTAILGIRGTDFFVRVTELLQTIVVVRSGRVDIRGLAGGPQVPVGEGQSVRVSSAGVSAPPATGAEPEVTTETTTLATLLFLGGNGATDAGVTPQDLSQVWGRRALSRAASGGTAASQTGGQCGGC
jgi:hypothetical protein